MAKKKFEVQKAPPKLYRIGEIVKYTSFSRQTIHNYTVIGLIHEAQWTEGKHRLYDESVFDRLFRIAQLKQAGRTLREIQVLLDKESRKSGTRRTK
jgi:DNA-binding transcriptional MerR regulator